MDKLPVTLAVDVGTETTVAVAAAGSRRIPVLFGNAAATPSALTLPAHDPGGEPVPVDDPRGALSADAHGVAAMAALLRRVAEAATATFGPPTALVMTVPPAWGPRRHALLRQAAATAGLPVPAVVAEPVAAAAHAHSRTPVPDGGCVLVCDIGTGATDVSVVQHTGGTWQLLSTIAVPQAGTRILELALAGHLPKEPATDSGHAPEVMRAVRAALSQLADTGRAAVALPDPHPPALLTREHLQLPVAQMRDAILAAAGEAVAAADIDVDQLAATVALGDAAHVIGAADALRERFGLPPVPLETGTLAHAHGALDAHDPTTTNGRSPAGGGRLRVRHLAAVVLPSAAAGLLAIQDITDTLRLLPNSLVYTTDDYAKITAYFNMPQYATAAMFATWAAIAGGRFAAATLLRLDHTEACPGRHTARAGRLLAFTSAVGLAIAGLFGLLADAVFGGPAGIAPDFLTPALLAAAPSAAVAITVGLAAPLIPALRDKPWADPLHHPVTAMLLAAAGILGMQAAWNGLPFDTPIPYNVVAVVGGRGGAALLGVAVALTLTRRRGAAAALAAVLGLGFAIVHVPDNDNILITIYLVTAAAWWIRQAAAVALLAIPGGLLKRLTGN